MSSGVQIGVGSYLVLGTGMGEGIRLGCWGCYVGWVVEMMG